MIAAHACDHGGVSPTPSPAPRAPHWQLPGVASNRVVGGVAAGIAEELGVDPMLIRVAFISLTAAGGAGVLVYGLAWIVMSRVNPVPGPRPPKAMSDAHRLFGVGFVLFGALLLLRGLGAVFVDSLVWPIALSGSGIAVAHDRGVDLKLGANTDAGPDRSAFLVRVAGGAVLVLGGVIMAAALNFSLRSARDSFLVVGIVVAGLGLVMGPWVTGLVDELTAERRARLRSDERAEVAAHLHDSVLQTLSLIQRRADDAQVVSLARTQERELRRWLFGGTTEDAVNSFRSALEAALAEIEELHSVPVEVVVVGDAMLDDSLNALLAATREAVTNAAVHSQAGTVDVFAELREDSADVFVRDTGVGFDLDQVSMDRRGVADSIVGRMDRIGGTATITTGRGSGTEVELHLDRRTS